MRIVFNEQTYESPDQMPPEIWQKYLEVMKALGDMDANGVPSILPKAGASTVTVKERLVYNGKEYESRDALPPEVRAALDNLPPPRPEAVKTVMEVQTRVLPPKVQVTVRDFSPQRSSGAGPAIPRWLVPVLLGIIAWLLFLWLSGTKPADLWRR